MRRTSVLARAAHITCVYTCICVHMYMSMYVHVYIRTETRACFDLRSHRHAQEQLGVGFQIGQRNMFTQEHFVTLTVTNLMK